MELAQVTKRVRDVPWMSPDQGALIYRHFRDTRPNLCLELGTAYGSSAAYMAAALAANGSGHLITVDRAEAGYSPASVIDELGLADWVTFVVRGDSSYDWYLKELVQERSDEAGNCDPMFDFCYLDGAHDWTIDGLAVILIEKLLMPGGWLLLDDLEWCYAASPTIQPPASMSQDEIREPHMRAVFDLIVRQHPNFSHFKLQDGNWGWAAKNQDAPRRYEVTSSRSIAGLVATAGWKLARIAFTRARRIRQAPSA